MQIPELTVDIAPGATGAGRASSAGAPPEGFGEALADVLGEVDELTMAIAAAGMVAAPQIVAAPLADGAPGTGAPGEISATTGLTAGIDAGTERLLASLMVGGTATTATTATATGSPTTVEEATASVTPVVGAPVAKELATDDAEHGRAVGPDERPGIARAMERAADGAAVHDLPIAPPAHGHDRIDVTPEIELDLDTPAAEVPLDATPAAETAAPVASTEAPETEQVEVAEPAMPAMPAMVDAAPARDAGPVDRAGPAAARTPLSEIDRSLVDAVRQLREGREESRHMVLHLDPPELGAVNVRLVARGDEIHLTMHTAHGDARSALTDQRSSIQDAFAAAGLELRDFDITGGDPDQRARDDARPGTGQRTDLAFDDAEPAMADGALRL